MIRVLSAASEVAPLIKTGGLADVAGALPAALAPEGVEVRTLLPGYRKVMQAAEGFSRIHAEGELFGGPAWVLAGQAHGLDLLILDAPHLFDRDGGPYLDAQGADWADNDARFAALSWMAARIAAEGIDGWTPDILHCHDWQTGFAPAYLKARGSERPSIMTVHNMAFHGMTGADRIGPLALPGWAFHPDGFEYWGGVSALKAGLVYAWKITTVSPTYARELRSPDFGEGLDGLIRARAADVTGILNGIDETVWSPSLDAHAIRYKDPRGKAKAREALAAEFHLAPADGPLCVVVSRLSAQKGLDLLLQALPGLLARGGRLALLGSGDPALEAAFREAATHPQVGVRIGYDEALSHRMIAGGDAILVPSRFEPCGLTQLYGLKYGTVPVVARTGGLADTMIDANPAAIAAGAATGVQFAPATAEALSVALDRLCDLHADPRTFAKLQRNGMKSSVGWGASAAAYASLYRRLLS